MAVDPKTAAKDFVIERQNLVEEVIDKRLNNSTIVVRRGTAVIASPTADAASLKIAVDAIRAQLTARGITA